MTGRKAAENDRGPTFRADATKAGGRLPNAVSRMAKAFAFATFGAALGATARLMVGAMGAGGVKSSDPLTLAACAFLGAVSFGCASWEFMRWADENAEPEPVEIERVPGGFFVRYAKDGMTARTASLADAETTFVSVDRATGTVRFDGPVVVTEPNGDWRMESGLALVDRFEPPFIPWLDREFGSNPKWKRVGQKRRRER